ncbi:hypothetical protein [Erythrobacter sp.]|jgi:hypothetical protein|uniref:hypothetical protein n=1 Tax=Erythrobacter sp. TaxID=1042 RepID=UPI002EAA01E9|nr:hypothetical protein [Erythrobacter sp.]
MSISNLAGEMESAKLRELKQLPPRGAASSAAAPAKEGQKPKSKTSQGFDALTRYIPTETITLYVGAVAAKDDLAGAFGLDVWDIYWIAAAATPILLALVTLAKHRAAGHGEPITWHWWPFVASLIGFLVWGTSVPGHPYADELNALPAFAALVASTLLALFDPIFLPKGHKSN